jgi:hypothetical protein
MKLLIRYQNKVVKRHLIQTNEKISWILVPSPIQCAYGVYVYLAPDKHNIHILFRVFSPHEDDRSTDKNVQAGGDFSVYVAGLSQAGGRGATSLG